MLQSIYTAKLGIQGQQKRVDVLANNIANVNTYGHKAARVDFKDALYENMRRPENPQTFNLLRGTGVLVSNTTRNVKQGSLIETKRVLDVAIEGNGYFAVRTTNGDIQYTRDGALAVSVEDDANYLVDVNGSYLLDVNGQRIGFEGDASQMKISQDGSLRIGDGPIFATIGAHTFDNVLGLGSVGNNNYVPSESSGEARPAVGVRMTQGYLEGSNVEIAMEMTRLIRAQRALQLNSRAVRAADEMEGTINSIR